jgi:hypothetical protein
VSDNSQARTIFEALVILALLILWGWFRRVTRGAPRGAAQGPTRPGRGR